MGNEILPSGPGGRLIRNTAARWWWVALGSGVFWFLIAWLVLRANITSLRTVGVLVGGVFVVAAVSEMVLAGIMRGGWRAVHVALAVVFTLGALWGFIRPIDTFFALASVLGLLLFLQGIFYMAQASAMRDVSPYWWVTLVSGLLFVALGMWMALSDRVWDLAGRTFFILAAVGFYAIFRGISDVGLAFDLRHIAKGAEGAAQEPADQRVLRIPPQERDQSPQPRQVHQPTS